MIFKSSESPVIEIKQMMANDLSKTLMNRKGGWAKRGTSEFLSEHLKPTDYLAPIII